VLWYALRKWVPHYIRFCVVLRDRFVVINYNRVIAVEPRLVSRRAVTVIPDQQNELTLASKRKSHACRNSLSPCHELYLAPISYYIISELIDQRTDQRDQLIGSPIPVEFVSMGLHSSGRTAVAIGSDAAGCLVVRCALLYSTPRPLSAGTTSVRSALRPVASSSNRSIDRSSVVTQTPVCP
jgi:hypothetical protein